YKLQVISEMLALAAAGSMFGWPLYNLGKNLHKRGRLPDMKRARVTFCAMIVAAVVLFVLLVPLPVSRVRQVGVVEPQSNAVQKLALHVPFPCILEDLKVHDGQWVEEGVELAKFSSRELESQLLDAETQHAIRVEQLKALDRQLANTFDLQEQEKI